MVEVVGSMAEGTQTALVPAVEVARQTTEGMAPNGVRYAAFADTGLGAGDLERLVQAVPAGVATALANSVYYFVPLAMADTRPSGLEGRLGHRDRPEETMISPHFSPELAELAICHRNVTLGSADGVFISTRLLPDRFSLAFEFFINVSHALVDAAGVAADFSELAWRHVTDDVRGETSHEAWEQRGIARGTAGAAQDGAGPKVDEAAKSAYLEAAFSDAVAIYMLSLALDFDYAELRERDYPLLAPQALGERLRHIHRLFPPNSGYEFAIRYRRRG